VGEYRKYMSENAPDIIRTSLHQLSLNYDLIIAEGAGSPAEINLDGNDFANTFVSSLYSTPCILVTDIHRGGAFASIYGTLKLMPHSELARWFVINRMSGDASLLDGGVRKLEELTGTSCLGVIPRIASIDLPGEDSMNYMEEEGFPGKIAVVRYPFMENYSDIDPLRMGGIPFSYVDSRNLGELEHASSIILPGSKNVPADLEYMKKYGIDRVIIEQAARGKKILGICGGYQMLGGEIVTAPEDGHVIRGLSILNCRTIYSREKTVRVVHGILNESVFGSNDEISGYEIHYGTVFTKEEKGVLKTPDGTEGSVSHDGMVIGTNVHSILENDKFLRYFAEIPAGKKGFQEILEKNMNSVRDHFISNMDMKPILTYVEKE
jgi:adenosylcobyric acid synthase